MWVRVARAWRSRTRATRVRIVAVAATGLAATALLWPVWPAVSVEGDDAELGVVPLDPGESFTLSFVHSLDKLPVEDVYEIRDGRIVQEATRVREFGAGMGHIPGRGEGHAEGEWWVVSGIDEPIDDFRVLVGSPGTDHRLVYPGGEVSLTRCWAGERVTLRAVRQSTLARVLPGAGPPSCTQGEQEPPGNET
ncbi:hypothetical protein F4561_000510 [Lipingzhangella halophila]|uniref:DUF1850 domain-containing protein n=1 Tax=Lipingzhangella halophila TaxID=1783352 RepID=A0A7W7RDB2_9ACTN|nr:DUF1850 domain-containing protein [Lipingzhangella halophila]MBB4929690.1 hypothetical protein [Lipingzhangella halophila]